MFSEQGDLACDLCFFLCTCKQHPSSSIGHIQQASKKGLDRGVLLMGGGGGDTHLGYGILGGKKSGIWDMRAKNLGYGIWGNHLGYGI